MSVKKQIVIFLLIISTVLAYAGYGYYGDAFILAGKSAQSIAMGGIGVSSLTGIKSVISNPAGLAGFRSKEVYTQYNNLYGLAFQNSIGMSLPFGKYQVGVILNTVGAQLNYREDIIREIPNINDRREYLSELTSVETFYDLENALLLSFAQEIPINVKIGWSYDRFTMIFQYGVNAKIIYKTLDSHSALGAGVDAGARLTVSGKDILSIRKMGDITFALNIENVVQSPINWFDGQWMEQGNMRLLGGLSFVQAIESLESEILIAAEGYVFESEFFPDYGIRYGLQWNLKDFLDFRIGKDLNSVTGGLGCKLDIPTGTLKIDYAIQYHEINWSHLISVSYFWSSVK